MIKYYRNLKKDDTLNSKVTQEIVSNINAKPHGSNRNCYLAWKNKEFIE